MKNFWTGQEITEESANQAWDDFVVSLSTPRGCLTAIAIAIFAIAFFIFIA
jgi:hypothetical protein